MNAEIEKYRGRNFPMRDKIKRSAYELSSRTSLQIYPSGSVDAVFFDDMLLLCKETADYLYSEEYTPLSVLYLPGSRPFLEKIVVQQTSGKKNTKEKLLSLMEYVRDINERNPVPDEILKLKPGNERTIEATQIFYGGTEEELI
ncbi:MAG: hypothetical protein AB1798_24265, partial [Spirochaetota bacterium]